MVKNNFIFIFKIFLKAIFLLVFVAFGCSPLKNLSSNSYKIEPINKQDFTKLNGRYYLYPDSVFGKIRHNPDGNSDVDNKSLTDRFFVFYPFEGIDSNPTIDINFTSKRKATIKVYNQDSVLFSKHIHGRFKKGYFYVRPKMFVIPFFPIFYWHNFERVRIGKIGNDIIVDHTMRAWGFALIAGSADNGSSTSIYRKVENQKSDSNSPQK